MDAARSIVEGILRDLPYPIDRFKKVFEFFKSIEEINILGSGITVNKEDTKKEISAQTFLHDILVNLWQDIEDKTDVFVILLDDVENFIDVSEIFMTLKSVLSIDSVMKTKILVGLASTSSNWLDITSVQKHHPLSRYFLSRVELTPLTEDELKDTIQHSLSGTGVSFSPEIIQLVFDYTKGHPFEMQLLCYHLFSNHLSRYVGTDIWKKSLQATIRDIGNAIFEKWCLDTTVDQAKILRILAEVNKPLSINDIQNIISNHGSSMTTILPLEESLSSLVNNKVVDKDFYGLYTIQDRMFCAYLVSNFQYPN